MMPPPRPHKALFLVLMALSAVAAAAAAQPPTPTEPARPQGEFADDPHYGRVLGAYRHQLSTRELEVLDEVDPAYSLYSGPSTPGERAITRLFASLPDQFHSELRRTGYLKWSAASLPDAQRRLIREHVRQLERRRAGPFPLEGRSTAATGFARVEVPGVDGAQYCWWIAAPGGQRLEWLTVVRALGGATQVYAQAYNEQLPPRLAQPDTAPVPAGAWLKNQPARRPEPVEEEAAPLMDEKHFWLCVRACRGRLDERERAALAVSDPVLIRGLKEADPVMAALYRLFAGLSEKEHRLLLTTGVLRWPPGVLSAAQRKLLAPILAGYNDAAQLSGSAGDIHSVDVPGQTITGFAIVAIPGVERPVVSWWLKSRGALLPTWVTLLNASAAGDPNYHRAHLQALLAQ